MFKIEFSFDVIETSMLRNCYLGFYGDRYNTRISTYNFHAYNTI